MISIVVPIYNTEAYLPQCIESILNQSYDNIELILVNDGSTDNSGEICEKYMRLDNRVKYINQKNGGVSKARKIGTDAVVGEFTMYVDSDDWLDLSTCRKVLTFIETNNLDIAYFSYSRDYERKSLEVKSFKGNKIFKGKDQIDFLQRRLIGIIGKELINPLAIDSFSAMYMKIFKTELIRSSNARFIDLEEIHHHEDTVFNIDILEKAKSVGYFNECLYHYRKVNQSSISKSKRLSFFKDWQVHLDILELFIEKNNKNIIFYEAFNNRVALECIGMFLKLNAVYEPFFLKRSALKMILNCNRYEKAFFALKIRYMPFHWKIFFIFCKIKFATGLIALIKLMSLLKSKF